MKLFRSPFTYIIAYLAMIVVTYGHAWKTIIPYAPDAGSAMFATVWASFVWPLWWSVQLWK